MNELIPSHVVQILNQIYKKNTFQMLYLSGEMEQISKLFNENEIRTSFFKRPVLRRTYMEIFLFEHQVIWMFLFLFKIWKK